MPTLYLHYKFGRDVLKELNNNFQNMIEKNINYYDMFNQGFDNLYYYHFKWHYYKNFGIKAHKTNLDTFFQNIFQYIKNNNLKNNSKLTNMIYGFINHLTLDTIMHPYINYQVKNLNIPHTKIEFMLDKYYYHLDTKKNWSKKIYKSLIPKVKFTKDLNNLLNYTFENTYQINNIGKVFRASHNNCYYVYTLFIYDKTGIKTFFYKIFDKIKRSKDFYFSENSFYIKKIDERILNANNITWHNPQNRQEQYNYSVQELYNISVNIATTLQEFAYQVIYNNYNEKEFIEKIKLLNINNIARFH